MPFQKGQIGNPEGRRGYEYEKVQVEKMRKMITKYLELVDNFLNDKAETNDYAKITTIGADMRKILDKLHASKEEVSGEVIEKVVYVKSV